MKTILVILDGLADRAQEGLKGLTPLETAHTPHLDYLCNRAETGIMVPYRQGLPLGTETAHFILFGYDLEDFPGRGAIEALGEGTALREDEIYLRTTFGFVEKGGGFLVKSRDTRELSEEEAKLLARAFPSSIEGVNIEWKHSFDVHG
ncbi:MAG: phosphoglycerate mutase, partial [Candidatus Syntrophonatronum acetioxidans]